MWIQYPIILILYWFNINSEELWMEKDSNEPFLNPNELNIFDILRVSVWHSNCEIRNIGNVMLDET